MIKNANLFFKINKIELNYMPIWLILIKFESQIIASNIFIIINFDNVICY